MNTLNNVKVHNIYNKTKNFLNRPVESLGPLALAFAPGLAATGASAGIIAATIAIMAVLIGNLEAELVYLITYIPTYDLVQDPFNESGFTGSSIYYSFLLLRDLSFYVFLLVFGILGVLILIENLNIAGMNMNKIKDTFKTTFIALIIIMIFPVLWDGFAESASKSAIWILNPLYNTNNLDTFKYCLTDDGRQIPKTSRTGCYDDNTKDVIPLHNIFENQTRCIDQVYQATMTYDTNYDIDNDNLIGFKDILTNEQDIVFIHHDKHVQTILNDNFNMYQLKDKQIHRPTFEVDPSKEEIDYANLKTEPSLNITNKNDMKGDFHYGLINGYLLDIRNQDTIYNEICDPGLRISYVYHRAYHPTRTVFDDTSRFGYWDDFWSDPLKAVTIEANDKFREIIDVVFFRPLFVTVLFMVSIGLHVAMYSRLFVTEFIMAGFPLFVALSLLLRPFTQKIATTLEETFVIAPIPLLIMPFFVGLVFFIGSLTLLNGESNLVTTINQESVLDETGIPGLADRGFGLWLQGLMVVTFAALIPALFLPFLKGFDNLTKQIGQGLTRSMVALNAAMTSMAVGGIKGGGVGGMNMGVGPGGGKPSGSTGDTPTSPGSGGSTGDNTAGMGNTKSGGESDNTTGGTNGNQNIGIRDRFKAGLLGSALYGLQSFDKQMIGYEMQSMGGGSGTSEINKNMDEINKTLTGQQRQDINVKINENPNTPNRGTGPSTYHDDKS